MVDPGECVAATISVKVTGLGGNLYGLSNASGEPCRGRCLDSDLVILDVVVVVFFGMCANIFFLMGNPWL